MVFRKIKLTRYRAASGGPRLPFEFEEAFKEGNFWFELKGAFKEGKRIRGGIFGLDIEGIFGGKYLAQRNRVQRFAIFFSKFSSQL